MNAARLGKAGVLAVKKGGRWFVTQVPQQAPDPAPTGEYLSKHDVAQMFRQFADLLDGSHELDTYSEPVSRFNGRKS